MQNQNNKDYDVLIVGSGASGGMVAHVLAQKGIRCLMLDAGPAVDLQRNRVMKAVSDLPYRGFGKPGRFPHVTQANEFNANVWADEKLNPYTYDAKDPYYSGSHPADGRQDADVGTGFVATRATSSSRQGT